MAFDEKTRRELRETLLEMSVGEASEAQEARFCSLVLEDPDARRYAVTLLHQFAALEAVGGLPLRLSTEESTLSQGQSETASQSSGSGVHKQMIPGGNTLTTWASLAVAFAIGIICTVLVVSRGSDSTSELAGSVPDLATPIPFEKVDPESDGFVAQLVGKTGSVWNASAGQPLESGDRLRTQETVSIIEGIAKLKLINGLALNLEGPAAVSVDPDRLPVVQYGKVLASLPWGSKKVAVKTPLGEVHLDGDDVAGIGVFGSDLKVYVFRGEVLVSSRNPEDRPILLSKGMGKAVGIGPAGERRIYTAIVDPKMFASRNSITSDLLAISESYVDSVLQSQPVGYWRFENDVEGKIFNEISGKHHCTLGGRARLVKQEDNHIVEFGFGMDSGYLIADEPFDELAGRDYAIELWVKPSHFHLGSVVVLVKRRTDVEEKEKTGVLLEVQGEQVTGNHRPNALRFLHRSPPAVSSLLGTSCYTNRYYETRKWQYVVAVKEGAKMSLYVNGRVLATGNDPSEMVGGLSLVVGQLFSFESVRPFVGQIDELAIYDHALTSKVIKSRYGMVR